MTCLCGRKVIKNFGIFRNDGSFVDLCRIECRNEFRIQILAGGDASSGVVRSAPDPGKKKRTKKPDARAKETDVSKTIADQLDAMTIWNTRTQTGAIKTASGSYMRLCRTGTPDRIFASGLHVWIEVKKHGEPASAEQLATIAEIKSNGGLAFVLDNPDDLAFILAGLRKFSETIKLINGQVAMIQREADREIAAARARRKGEL